MVIRSQTLPLRVFMTLCTVAMVVVLFKEGFWLLMGSMALDRGPLPHAYLVNAILFIGFLISTCLFWKWPWIAASIAWLDLLAILLHANPWNDNSSATFFHQFVYDHIFFIAANLGLIAFLLAKRKSSSEAA